MRTAFCSGILILASLPAFAQQSGPALSIDAAANLHPISPDIYGIDFYWTLPDAGDPSLPAATAAAANIRATARRWGGDEYQHAINWKFDVNESRERLVLSGAHGSSVDASKLPAGSTSTPSPTRFASPAAKPSAPSRCSAGCPRRAWRCAATTFRNTASSASRIPTRSIIP